MGNVQNLSHSKWECIYHITWIPKYRKKKIYKELRKYLTDVFRELTRQKECKVMEGHLMSDLLWSSKNGHFLLSRFAA